MRQTGLHLTKVDRWVVDKIWSTGLHHARAVNRVHYLGDDKSGPADGFGRCRPAFNLSRWNQLSIPQQFDIILVNYRKINTERSIAFCDRAFGRKLVVRRILD